LPARPDLVSVARALRSNQTVAERKLWRELRQRQIEGFRFRRQAPMLGFVVDFACFDARLVVEVDGATHSSDEEIARDRKRDAILRENGNVILRFNNVEVYENLEGVLETIRLKLLELCPDRLENHRVPSPLVGEG
jgi:very-short-patch-repair endonuclease